MVGAFLTAIAGLESVARPENPMNFKPGEVLALRGIVHPKLEIEPYLVLQLVLEGHTSRANVSHSLTCMLVNTAYESVKDKNDRSPEFEFFRHIRNAASHQNHFRFIPSEPARPASWRGKVIDHNIKGSANPISGTKCFGQFLTVADAIALLWDMEAKV